MRALLQRSERAGLLADVCLLQRQFPAGKRRFQPLGILIFAVLQITAFSQVFLESITRLVDKKSDSEIVNLSWFGKGVGRVSGTKRYLTQTLT